MRAIVSNYIFDDMASSYDENFSQTYLGKYYRNRTHVLMEKYWKGNHKILDLNCGTGEDAVYLASKNNNILATDLSDNMLKIVNEKIITLNLEDKVSTKKLDLNDLDILENMKFDGVLSNFGGLNCIEDIQSFVSEISRFILPGGILIITLMGRYTPWEWLYFLTKMSLNKAFRRISEKSEWKGLDIYYPHISTVKQTLSNEFILLEQEALGVFMPPSYMNNFVENHSSVFNFLEKLESHISKSSVSMHLNDHYTLVYKRKNYDT